MKRLAPIALLLAAAGGPAPAAEAPAQTESIRMAPAPAATRERMARWHRDHHRRLSPVLGAWRGVARAAEEEPGGELLAGCRRLQAALARLDRVRLPTAPDPSVSLHLEETLRSLAEAAESCSHGAWFLTRWRLREAERTWRELRRRLLLYDLDP